MAGARRGRSTGIISRLKNTVDWIFWEKNTVLARKTNGIKLIISQMNRAKWARLAGRQAARPARPARGSRHGWPRRSQPRPWQARGSAEHRAGRAARRPRGFSSAAGDDVGERSDLSLVCCLVRSLTGRWNHGRVTKDRKGRKGRDKVGSVGPSGMCK
jgi:hypothetical protein